MYLYGRRRRRMFQMNFHAGLSDSPKIESEIEHRAGIKRQVTDSLSNLEKLGAEQIWVDDDFKILLSQKRCPKWMED